MNFLVGLVHRYNTQYSLWYIMGPLHTYSKYLDLRTLISDWLMEDISWHSRKELAKYIGLLTRVIPCSRIYCFQFKGDVINLRDCSATLNGNLCWCGRYLHRFIRPLFVAHLPAIGTCLSCEYPLMSVAGLIFKPTLCCGILFVRFDIQKSL